MARLAPETGVSTNSRASHGLNVDRIFAAPRELVWAAWTTPEMFVRWLGPTEWPAISATQNLVIGGRWSAILQDNSGKTLEQAGEYREIVPFERLVFTFRWVGDHEDGEPVDTLVTVALGDAPGGKTHMKFQHELLKSDASMAGHRQGWSSSFDGLDDLLRCTQWKGKE